MLEEQWATCPAMQRWRRGLAEATGLTETELASRQHGLFQFCAMHGLDPETMAEECRSGPARVERRQFYLALAQQSPANLIVQSFLIHNGINVFGDIVCMPDTIEKVVREQGEQWKLTANR
jgi:hypothetical protein